jgi:hypothetical protein
VSGVCDTLRIFLYDVRHFCLYLLRGALPVEADYLLPISWLYALVRFRSYLVIHFFWNFDDFFCPQVRS